MTTSIVTRRQVIPLDDIAAELVAELGAEFQEALEFIVRMLELGEAITLWTRWQHGLPSSFNSENAANEAIRISDYITERDRTDINEYGFLRADVDRIKAAYATAWTPARTIVDGGGGPHKPPYLDKSHPRFSHKLAAAIHAWETVTEVPEGTTVKQRMKEWLTQNFQRLGLANKDGSLNATGIEEVAKIANWKPDGGAPKTPEGTSLSGSDS